MVARHLFKAIACVICIINGAVIIPQALLEDVLTEGLEQEQLEAWILDQVNDGASLPGLYPMNEETKARYEKSKDK